MAWIESHTVLQRHRKLIGFAADLNIRRSHAMGHLHALWHNAIEQQEDGDLSAWSDETIAEMADFPGNPRQFVGLLKRHRWLERDRRLHDWWDYAGPFLRSKYKRTPEKWELVRNRYVTVTVPRTSPPNQPNQPTNQTKPNLTVESVRLGEHSEQQTAGRCDFTYPDKARCSQPRAPGAYMCRDHIAKCKELAANRQRSGGFQDK